jgi:hypothetical protein
MEIVLPEGFAASRTFLLILDSLLDALGAENMATVCRGRLHQLVPAHRAIKTRFLWNHCFSRLFANFCSIARLQDGSIQLRLNKNNEAVVIRPIITGCKISMYAERNGEFLPLCSNISSSILDNHINAWHLSILQKVRWSLKFSDCQVASSKLESLMVSKSFQEHAEDIYMALSEYCKYERPIIYSLKQNKKDILFL